MPYFVIASFEINEGMVQSLLMLEVLITRGSKVKYLFYGAPCSLNSSAWGLSLFKMIFSMTLLE